MSKRIWCDTKCFELAEAFLDDERAINTKENQWALAGEIQTVIEEFIADKLAALAPTGARRDG